MNTQELIEKQIYNAVVSEIDKNKQIFSRFKYTFLVQKYKKAEENKRTSYDDDDFGIGDEDESEGYELDFLWDLLKNADRKVSLNLKQYMIGPNYLIKSLMTNVGIG